MTMRKTFQHLLVFYSIFLAARTAFSFKRICRVAGPTTGEYLVVRNSRNGVSDPSLINRNNFDTSLNMASIYGNMMGSNDLTKTIIESPTLNSRKITASIIVNSPIQDVWSIITDYNQLAVHVPNLVKSYVIPSERSSSSSSSSSPYSDSTTTFTSNNNNNNNNFGISKIKSPKVRIFQEGAQKIVGFDFRASLTMDMTEEIENEGRAMAEKKTLYFKLAESGMFSSFDGNWSIRYHSRNREFDVISREFVFRYKTMLTYSVLVKPKGPVPVIALEWRIKEDVPVNLIAMKVAAEKVTSGKPKTFSSDMSELRTEWGADETLGMYLGKNKNLIVKSEVLPVTPWIPRVTIL